MGGRLLRSPADLATEAEDRTDAVPGPGDRFAGYGVMGQPFASGHVLAMRRFPASSVGPGYTSVWHRTPAGAWTFWQDQPAELGCARYFADGAVRAEIEVTWPGSHQLRVRIGEVGLDWTTAFRSTPVTRALSAVASRLPGALWSSPAFLRLLGPVAGAALRTGPVGLAGIAPNGQRFVANPLLVWLVGATAATLDGVDLGPAGPLPEQAALGDFRIPQRGVLAFGRAAFESS